MRARAHAPRGALLSLLLLVNAVAAAEISKAPPPAPAAAAARAAGNNSTNWRPPAVAERRGWVPLNMPCPTCRLMTLVGDSSPQGAAIVGRAIPPPPQFAQQQIPQQPQQPYLQPFQQQLLLNQHPSFSAPQQPPPSAIAALPGDVNPNLYLLRPQASPPTAVGDAFGGPSSLPPPPLQQQDLQQVSQRPPQSARGDSQQSPPREEVQLLYVPVEALRPRGRGPPPPLQQRSHHQQQLQSQQIPPQLLFQTQSPPPLLQPSPTTSTTTSTTTTTLATTTLVPLQGRHRFRGAAPQIERSRYLEQSIPIPSPSEPSPVLSQTSPHPSTPAPHQPPLSIFVGRHSANGNTRIGDVIVALRGSRSIAVMDEPGPEAPEVFVGPANLAPPPGFAKFELPYLSAIMAASRGEHRVDRLPFFVAPLSFRPPPGYSKIPFPAPHVGSVVVANSTIPAGSPQTTTPAVSTVSLPADLPPISAELPALVNSLQDARTPPGDVLLLPAARESHQGKRLSPKQQKILSQDYQPQQQQIQQPNRQQTPIQYRQTTVVPPYSQQQYIQQQIDEYQTQPPVTDLYQDNPQLPVQDEHTTNIPQSVNTYQQPQINQYQQEYIQTVPPQPIQQHRLQQQTLPQQHLAAQQQQFLDGQRRPSSPVHEESYPVTEAELSQDQEQALQAGLHTLHAGLALQQETAVPETTPVVTTSTTSATTSTTHNPRRQHFRGRQRVTSSLASASPSGSVSPAAPEPTRRPTPARTRRPVHPSRVRGDDGSSFDGGNHRGNHRFRGRGPTRQTTTSTQFTTSTDATTPYNRPGDTTQAYQQGVYDPIGETTPSYQQLGFNGADTSSEYSQSDYNPVEDTTPTYQQPSYRPVVETTPQYQQRPSYSSVERTPQYEQPSYSTIERTPERKRPSHSPIERAPDHHQRPTYTSVERVPERQRNTYTVPERVPEQPQQPVYSSVERTPEQQQQQHHTQQQHVQQPAYTPERGAFQPVDEENPNNQGANAAVGGESDPNPRATPAYTQQQVYPSDASLPDALPSAPVDPTAAQYLDNGNFRPQHGVLAAYGGTSERTPDTTVPEIPESHELPVVENSTPTADDASSTHPPIRPGTFQRTRGRKGYPQVKYQSTVEGNVNGNGVAGEHQSSPTPRPVQVRLRGRVRSSSRPRPPPEPENYPANFHDAAVFDATRRPAGDYNTYEAAVPPSSTEAITRAPVTTRNRGNFLVRGAPRRPDATGLGGTTSSATAATDAPTTPSSDKVYTVRPARRPQPTQQTRITSVRGRIRKPTTTPRSTSPASTTTAAAAITDHIPSAHAGGFQANEVVQQQSVPQPDYYDYLAAEGAQESPSGIVADFRRPYTVSYEDDDPEAGGAESQWTGKWHQQNPNSLPTEPSIAKDQRGINSEQPGNGSLPTGETVDTTSSALEDFFDLFEQVVTMPPHPSSELLLTTPSPTEEISKVEEVTSLKEPVTTSDVPRERLATPTPLEKAMALGEPKYTTSSPEATATGSGAPERKRRVRVRVRTRVNLRDTLEPAESQNIATLANSIPSAAAKKPSFPTRELPQSSTEPIDASSSTTEAPELFYDTTTASPTDSITSTTPLGQDSEALYTTSKPPTEAVLETTDAPEEESFTQKPDEGLTFTGPGADGVDPAGATSLPAHNEDSKMTEEESELLDDLAAVSAREEQPAEELPSALTTEIPVVTTTTQTSVPTPTEITTVSPVTASAPAVANSTTVVPDPSTPAGKLYNDIQRARAATRDGPANATVRLIGTSTTTEVSHETEICYRGRCVKTKTQPDSVGRGP